MRAWMRWLWERSIWHPGSISLLEGELAADVKRKLLPLFDLVLIGAAVLAIRGGMPSFVLVYDDAVSDVASWTLLLAASSCLIGVAVPRLWLLEVGSKLVLFSLLFGYGVVMIGASFFGDPSRGFVGGAMLAVSLLPAWRILWLGREWRRRKGD